MVDAFQHGVIIGISIEIAYCLVVEDSDRFVHAIFDENVHQLLLNRPEELPGVFGIGIGEDVGVVVEDVAKFFFIPRTLMDQNLINQKSNLKDFHSHCAQQSLRALCERTEIPRRRREP